MNPSIAAAPTAGDRLAESLRHRAHHAGSRPEACGTGQTTVAAGGIVLESAVVASKEVLDGRVARSGSSLAKTAETGMQARRSG
jgi:hypothetical protein